MKKVISLFLLVILVMCFAGCNSSSNNLIFENKYIENQDNQYMYENGIGITPLQKGQDEYYYLYNHFLYFIDNETFTVNPICSKSDCLHDKETITDKISKCNAFISNYGPEKIRYYDGSLYYISADVDLEKYSEALKKYNIATQSVDTVLTFKKGIGDWTIHRGYLYYSNFKTTNEEDSIEDDEIINNEYLYRIALGKSENDSEPLFDFEKVGLSVLDTFNMHAYGNYVYYDAVTAPKGTSIDELDDEEVIFGKRYAYNILNGEQVCLNDVIGENIIPYYSFYKNKIVYGIDCNICTCDLDGENSKVLFTYDKKLRQYTKFSDGKYFYFENTDHIADDDYKSTYLVYNFKGEKINTVNMPFYISYTAPSDNNYIIFSSDQFGAELFEPSGNAQLYVIDKSKINSESKLKAKSIYKFN